jgi:cytoskeletal protein RodZ
MNQNLTEVKVSIFDRLRKKNNEENEDGDSSIYKDETKPNRLASFMFGFFALLLTLLIAGGLFFGVRAIYRAIHGNNNSSSTASHQTDQSNTNASDSQKNSSATDTNGSQSGSNGENSGGAAAGSQSGGSGTPSRTPSTGDNLPNTGDNLTLPKTGDPGM